MKVIVVSGAHSNVGKTQLARALCSLLSGAVRIKIGHGNIKPDDDGYFYHLGTNFSTILKEHSSAPFLVIESNSILKEITPECAIYLPDKIQKPSAEVAIKKADITRGELITASKISALAVRLECDETMIRKIVELSGAIIK
jgi:hypothetical protein